MVRGPAKHAIDIVGHKYGRLTVLRFSHKTYGHQSIGYHNYGGRGIKVCKRWQSSFNNFLLDMDWPPTDKHTIDRINVNGNYKPSNCRWATRKEQACNKRQRCK